MLEKSKDITIYRQIGLNFLSIFRNIRANLPDNNIVSRSARWALPANHVLVGRLTAAQARTLDNGGRRKNVESKVIRD